MLFPMFNLIKIISLRSPLSKPLVQMLSISSMVVAGCVLPACQQPTQETQVIEIQDDIGKIFITDESITVQPEHIAHIKSERYQPSLSLYGRLTPIKQSFIRAPQNIKLLQVAVDNQEMVSKGQLLFTALPVADTNTKPLKQDDKHITSTKHTDNTIPQPIAPKHTTSQHLTPQPTEDTIDISYDTAYHDINRKRVKPISIVAPFAGKVQHLYYQQDKVVNNFAPTVVRNNQPLMILSDESDWQFISLLPAYTQSKLSIGQHVNFSPRLDNKKSSNNKNHNSVKLTGQISDIATHKNKAMSVTVRVLPDDNRPFPLKQGLPVQGKVDYGQIEVGTLIAQSGVHPILTHETYGGLATDLSVFSQPNAHVVAPVKAYVWIVNHDRQLKRQVVDVISFDKQSKQYLVAGIPSEVLICLVDLPRSAQGRLLKVS